MAGKIAAFTFRSLYYSKCYIPWPNERGGYAIYNAFLVMTITAAFLQQVAHAEGPARLHGLTELAAAAGTPAAYAVLVQTLAETADDWVAYLCLDTLRQHCAPLLQADAPRMLPRLLELLFHPYLPVADRIGWVLNTAGPASVPALLAAIDHAPDTHHRVRYMAVLRSSYHLLGYAPAVLACLSQHLHDPDPEVRYWALVVLMDLSPLREGYDYPRLPAAAFEGLYPNLLAVAEELLPLHGHDGFPARYRTLILDYWQQRGHSDEE